MMSIFDNRCRPAAMGYFGKDPEDTVESAVLIFKILHDFLTIYWGKRCMEGRER
jgi:hypothetical protein